MNSLYDFKQSWQQNETSHTYHHELFCNLVNTHIWLNSHRTYCENHVIAFGERSFWWFFNLIISELPNKFSFLEIGCHRGGTLGLIGGLAELYNKESLCVGVSPFDGTNINIFRDYEPECHDFFNYSTNNSSKQKLVTIKGFSQLPKLIEKVKQYNNFDLVFLDGDHTYPIIKSDILNYASMIKLNGYLLIDDSCNNMNMKFGYFQGIEEVTKATEELLPYNKVSELPTGEQFEFMGSIVHCRLYKRIK